jgi:hypothetical protein
LKDNVSLALGDIGKSISEAFNLKELIPRVTKRIQLLVDRFRNLDDQTKKNLVTVAAIAAAIGPALIAFGAIIKAVVAVRVALAALASPIGLIVLGLTALVPLVASFAFKTDDVGKALKTANRGIRTEQIQTGILFKKLKNVNISQEERQNALDELKAKYPSYLGNLNLEEESLIKIEAAQDKVNAAIVRRIAAQKKAQAQNEIAAKIAEKLIRIEELSTGEQLTGREALRLRGSGLNRIGSKGNEERRQFVIQSLIKDTQNLEGQLEKLDKTFDRVFEVKTVGGVGAKGRLGGLEEEVKETAKTVESETEEITKSTDKTISRVQALKAQLGSAYGFIFNSIERAARVSNLFGASQEKISEASPVVVNGIANSYNAVSTAIKAATEATQIYGQKEAEAQKRREERFGVLSGLASELGLKFEEAKGFFVDFIGIGASALGGLVDAFGNAITGAANFGQSLGKVLKDILGKLLKAALAAAAFAAIISLIPGLGIASGLTAGFGGNFLSIIKNGFTGLAKGGIIPPGFPGDSYPALLSSGEAVIPLDRLNEFGGGGILEARISGRDLLLLLNREQKAQSRTI